VKNYTILIPFLILLFFLFGCGDGDCLKSSGAETSEERMLSDFKAIELSDLFNVWLVNDTITKIIVETGENLISDIKTEISDTTLKISNTSKCRFLRGYGNYPKLIIHVKDLKLVQIYEPCNVYTIDTLKNYQIQFIFNADISTANLCIESTYLTLDLWSDVTGEYTIKGKSFYLISNTYGYSKINAKDLECDNIILNSVSTGNITVTAKSTLNVTILGSGNVYYYGNPVITQKIEGAGKIIKAD
jgi:hypothetical protein